MEFEFEGAYRSKDVPVTRHELRVQRCLSTALKKLPLFSGGNHTFMEEEEELTRLFCLPSAPVILSVS